MWVEKEEETKSSSIQRTSEYTGVNILFLLDASNLCCYRMSKWNTLVNNDNYICTLRLVRALNVSKKLNLSVNWMYNWKSAIESMCTLDHRQTVTYLYGCIESRLLAVTMKCLYTINDTRQRSQDKLKCCKRFSTRQIIHENEWVKPWNNNFHCVEANIYDWSSIDLQWVPKRETNVHDKMDWNQVCYTSDDASV